MWTEQMQKNSMKSTKVLLQSTPWVWTLRCCAIMAAISHHSSENLLLLILIKKNTNIASNKILTEAMTVSPLQSMVTELCSGPCMVLEIQGADAPQTFREFCGPPDPVSRDTFEMVNALHSLVESCPTGKMWRKSICHQLVIDWFVRPPLLSKKTCSQ